MAPPTLVEVVQDLVVKGWVIRRPSVEDRRAVRLRLSRQGESIVSRIARLVSRLESMPPQHARLALGLSPQSRAL